MDNYLVKRISCILLSLVLTVSLAVSLLGLTGVLLLRNGNFIASKAAAYSSQFKADIDSEIEQQMSTCGVSVDLCKDAVDSGVMDYIVSVTSKNAARQSANDFSLDSTLYNKIYKNLDTAAKSQKASAAAAEIADIASLEADVINGVMSQVDTKNIAYLSAFQSTASGVAVIAGGIIAVAALILIDVVNNGRHRKNSYIGMSFASTGFIEIFAPLAALKFGFGDGVVFSLNPALNSTAIDALQYVVKLQIIYGVIMVLVGYTVLIINYSYFAKKNTRVKEQRELNAKMREDYMRHYESKNAPRPAPIAGEREEMKIDF